MSLVCVDAAVLKCCCCSVLTLLFKMHCYFELHLLFWNYAAVLKWRCCFEITLLFWNDIPVLKWCYYFEVMLLFWNDVFCFEMTFLFWNASAVLKWRCSFEVMLLFWNDAAVLKGCCWDYDVCRHRKKNIQPVDEINNQSTNQFALSGSIQESILVGPLCVLIS